MKNDQEKFRGLHNQEKKFFTYSHKNLLFLHLVCAECYILRLTISIIIQNKP